MCDDGWRGKEGTKETSQGTKHIYGSPLEGCLKRFWWSFQRQNPFYWMVVWEAVISVAVGVVCEGDSVSEQKK